MALRSRKFFNKLIGPVRNRFLVPFINRYVTHGIVIALTFAIVFLNYQVKETRAESFGERSILYALVKGSDFSDVYIEETQSEQAAKPGTSYLQDEVLGVRTTPEMVSTPDRIVETGETERTETFITQGGAVAPTGITSIEATKKRRDKIVNYEVQGGDTLSSIAFNFGLKTNSLLWANNLNSNSRIRPGQNLDIPPVDGIVYKVASGDNLGAVARKYNTEVDKIVEFNKLADASDINIGMTLMLPDGEPYRAPAPIQPTKIAPVRTIFTGGRPQETPQPARAAGLIWPTTTRRISQYYSWRHTALDIDGEFGDIIWASDDGVVTRVQYLNYGYGYHVIIDHGGGVETLYAHFQRIYVKPGDTVTQGQALGEMGSTGRSTGSHLHFEVRVRGSRMNPFAYTSR